MDKETLEYVRDLVADARKQAAELEFSHVSYADQAFFKGMRFAFDQVYNGLSSMIYQRDLIENVRAE